PRPEVSRKLDELVAKSAVSSVSQYVADVLALHVGLPEHVRELDRQEVLPLQTSA
ncbi:hypothetical protein H7H73_09845, partial [Mycobacterium rufum]|nr:hypothetical protein [Mycolicibacterium rufum]